MSWLAPVAAGSTFLVLLLLEVLWPLRRPVEPKSRRIGEERRAPRQLRGMRAVLQAGVPRRRGRLGRAVIGSGSSGSRASDRWRIVVGAVALDYTLWHWHRWNHVVPFLWRFHVIHHADRDLDAATGAALPLWRDVAVGWLPGPPGAGHGRGRGHPCRLERALDPVGALPPLESAPPPELERLLVPLIVTPRMHAIHHSNWREETDSNWSSLLSVWDRLHGTLRLDVPPESVAIGVPAYARPESVMLGRMLRGPFCPNPITGRVGVRRALPAGQDPEAPE